MAVAHDVAVSLVLWLIAVGLLAQIQRIWAGPPPGLALTPKQRTLDGGGITLVPPGLPALCAVVGAMAVFATSDVARRYGLIAERVAVGIEAVMVVGCITL